VSISGSREKNGKKTNAKGRPEAFNFKHAKLEWKRVVL